MSCFSILCNQKTLLSKKYKLSALTKEVKFNGKKPLSSLVLYENTKKIPNGNKTIPYIEITNAFTKSKNKTIIKGWLAGEKEVKKINLLVEEKEKDASSSIKKQENSFCIIGHKKIQIYSFCITSDIVHAKEKNISLQFINNPEIYLVYKLSKKNKNKEENSIKKHKKKENFYFNFNNFLKTELIF